MKQNILEEQKSWNHFLAKLAQSSKIIICVSCLRSAESGNQAQVVGF